MYGGTTKGAEIGSAHLGTPAGVRKKPTGRPVLGGGFGARLRRLVAGGAVIAGMVGMLAVPAVASGATDATRDEVALRASFALTALQMEETATTAEAADSAALRYRDLRKELVAVVSERAQVSFDDLDAAWARADDRRMTVVLTALTQVGVPYSFGSAEPGVAFDCSGLTSWAWGNAGIALEHSSYDQLAAANSPDHMVAMAGDLTGLAKRGHVAIYLGIDDLVVHAPNTGSLVRIDTLRGRLAWFAYPAQ
jgi:cell wall-associated NlpC family hydrolase